MVIEKATLQLNTNGFCDIIDLTREVQAALGRSGVTEGLCALFVPGSTAALTTIEAEPGVLQDLRECIERFVPQTGRYRHDAAWGDGNGFAHVRAALLGPSLSVPVVQGGLALGRWQQIVLIDFDNRPRSRRVLVQLIGERA